MIFAEITKRNYMSESVTLKSYFYEVLIPSSQKNTSSPIEDILHHVSKYIFYEKACALQMFQSTHPHGVRHDHPEATPLECWFQSTHPHGVRLLLRTSCARCSMFQSTHPHGVRQAPEKLLSFNHEFQSTHPHGVRPPK